MDLDFDIFLFDNKDNSKNEISDLQKNLINSITKINEKYKIISINNKLGIIDDQNRKILNTEYYKIEPIANTPYLKVAPSKYNGIIEGIVKLSDTSIEHIIPETFCNIEFNNGFFIVSIYNPNNEKFTKLYGLYSKDGDELIKPEYDEIILINENIFKLENDKFDLLFFANNERLIQIPSGDIIFIEEEGAILIKPAEYKKYINKNQGHMLLSKMGKVLSPLDTYYIGDFDKYGLANITVNSPIRGFGMYGKIDYKGQLYFKRYDKWVLMPEKYDWVTELKNGISDIKIGVHIGHINDKYQVVAHCVINNELKTVTIPSNYELGLDSNSQYICVIKNNLVGIIDYDGNEIVTPLYKKIEIVKIDENKVRFLCFLEDKIYKNFNGNFNNPEAILLDTEGNNYTPDIILNPIHLGNGIFRIDCEKEVNKYFDENILKYQVINENGILISNDKFSYVGKFGESKKYSYSTLDEENSPYLIFRQKDKYGAINKNGEIILKNLPFHISIKDIRPLLLKHKDLRKYFIINGIKVYFPYNYEDIIYIGEDIFKVSLKSSTNSDEITTSYINIHNQFLSPSFGNVGEIINNLFIFYFKENGINYESVLNTKGETIIPKKQEKFFIHNNFISSIDLNNQITLYSGDGTILNKENKFSKNYSFEDFGSTFIQVTYNDRGEISQGLLDNKGQEIYSYYDKYFSFEEIIPNIFKIKRKCNGTDCFLGDEKGHLYTYPYLEIEIHKNGLCVVYNQYYGPKGVIDLLGNKILPMKYEDLIILEEENLIKTSKGMFTLEGRYITFVKCPEGDRELILSNKYDYCKDFKGEYTIVYSDGKKGIINNVGEEILAPIYAEIDEVDNLIYKIKDTDGFFNLLNLNNGYFISPKYNEIGNLNNKHAITLIREENNFVKYGLISINKIILEAKYDFLSFNEDIVTYGIFNTNPLILNLSDNNIVKLPSDIVYLGRFTEGKIRFNHKGKYFKVPGGVRIEGGKWGFLNIKGEIIIEAKYSRCSDYINNIAPVSNNGKWGLINVEENLIVDYLYSKVDRDSTGYFLIKTESENEKWFRFNEEGKLISSGIIEDDEINDYYSYDASWDNDAELDYIRENGDDWIFD